MARTNSKQLRSIVKAIDDFSKTSWTSSEPNTKKKIIEPLLETLGWDVFGNEVMLEYSIKIGSTTKHVDYALMLENKPVVLVEAKSFDISLSPDDSAQTISYGRVEDVQWVVLTNGKTLKVFDTKQGKTEKQCLVAEINLTKLPQQANDLSLISRESILSGDIEDAAKRLAARKKAIQNLKQKQEQIAEEIKNILLKITGKKVRSVIENLSSQLAGQAIQLFEKQSEGATEVTLERDIPCIERKQLEAKPSGKVVICPSKTAGIEFLKKYNAWGFVNIREENIPYFALYVGKPHSSILYFGEIESITKPLKSKEDLIKIQKTDIETFELGKRVIHLKPGTLVKLSDPLPLKNRRFVPKARLYTTLEKLIQANCIEDILPKVTLENHLKKIKNAKMKKMAVDLRNAILKISDKIGERITKSHIIFRTSVNFAGIYTQPRGFWLSVRIPRTQFDMLELDVRPHKHPRWTDIRVDDKTSLDLLVEAAKIAYKKTL